VYTKLQAEKNLPIRKFSGFIYYEAYGYFLAFEVFRKPYDTVKRQISEIVQNKRPLLFRLLVDMTASVAKIHARSIVHNKVNPSSFLYKTEIKIIIFSGSSIGEDKNFEYS
jgi:hypothetical protein